MNKRTSFTHIFTTLPKRSQLAIGTALMAILTNYVARKTIKDMEDVNLAANVDKIKHQPPNWSCYYYAKQYREECSEYNRMRGGEYIEDICSKLEIKLRDCNRDLAKQIENCQPYAMDEPRKIANSQPWTRKHDDNTVP